jgi:hypothetical protein
MIERGRAGDERRDNGMHGAQRIADLAMHV